MIVSHKYKFIFIATPKTGTTSIHRALQRYVSNDSDIVIDQTIAGKHQTALTIKKKLPQEQWDSYFKFGFVRNPFDWIASWYNFRSRNELSDSRHPKHHRWTGNISFEEFVTNPTELVNSPGDYIIDLQGKIIVDFVGKYENLDHDFGYICNRLGLPHIQLPSLNISKKNTNPYKMYTPSAWTAVESRFKRDLMLFNYTRDLQIDRRKGRTFLKYIKDYIKSLLFSKR
jgi:hypothetical protein